MFDAYKLTPKSGGESISELFNIKNLREFILSITGIESIVEFGIHFQPTFPYINSIENMRDIMAELKSMERTMKLKQIL